jgi:hypothetical protein
LKAIGDSHRDLAKDPEIVNVEGLQPASVSNANPRETERNPGSTTRAK